MKAIVFDLTNTLHLFDWKRLESDFSGLLVKLEKTRKLGIEAFLEAFNKHYNYYQAGKIMNDEEFYEKIFEGLGIGFSGNEIQKIAADALAVRKNFVSLPANLEKTLKKLKQDFLLGVLSNGIGDWAEKDWKMLGFNNKKYFDTEIYSQYTGLLKPDKRAFDMTLERLGVKAEQAVMVGDSETEDIQGAKQAGLSTVWLKKERAKNCEHADHVIWEIGELAELKNKWKTG